MCKRMPLRSQPLHRDARHSVEVYVLENLLVMSTSYFKNEFYVRRTEVNVIKNL